MLFLFSLLLPLTSYAASYFVTPSGGGNHSGTSSGNPWSLAEFNGKTNPTGGDTVTFSGTFTGTVVPPKSGISNAARLTLNFAGATLTNADPRIQVNHLAYVNILGGSMSAAYDATLINFNPNGGGQSHDVTVGNWSYTGPANGISYFLNIDHVTNLVVSNCYVDNVSCFLNGSSVLNHDIDITGNFARTSTDVTSQDDLIRISDAANITIEKNKLIDRAPASSVNHNDVIQNFTKGGSNPGSPTNWILRYNWIEMQQRSGSGDNSFLMFQSMGGNPAVKIYGNVFYGSGTIGNNGICIGRGNGGSYYFYNNTVVRHNDPDNTVRFADSGTVYAQNNVGMADPSVGKYATFLLWTMAIGASDYNFYYGVYTAGGGPVNAGYAGPHGSVNINPMFTNYAGTDFSLSASSPLRGRGNRNIGAEFNTGIKAGSQWPNPTLTPRNTWDVGAFNQ